MDNMSNLRNPMRIYSCQSCLVEVEVAAFHLAWVSSSRRRSHRTRVLMATAVHDSMHCANLELLPYLPLRLHAQQVNLIGQKECAAAQLNADFNGVTAFTEGSQHKCPVRMANSRIRFRTAETNVRPTIMHEFILRTIW